MKTVIGIILLFSFSICTLYAIGSLDFTGESLVFKLSANEFKVSGDYRFSNYSSEDVTQTIYFPIPTDSTAHPATKIKIKLLKPLPGQNCKLMAINPHGFWFELTLPAKTIAVCHISYRQKLRGNSAKYVLMSTQSWGKPLEDVKYVFYACKNIKLKSISLPDPVVKTGIFSKKYTWEYKNYSPEQDFIVEF